jgi:hypothetical protein
LLPICELSHACQSELSSIVSTDRARTDHQSVDCPPPNSRTFLSSKFRCWRKSMAGYVYQGIGAPLDEHGDIRKLDFQWPVLRLKRIGVIIPVSKAFAGCQIAGGNICFTNAEYLCSFVVIRSAPIRMQPNYKKGTLLNYRDPQRYKLHIFGVIKAHDTSRR